MAARKINQKDYTHYVLVFRGGKPIIESGWSYLEDAKDKMREMLEFHPKLKVKVYGRTGLSKVGLDPNNNDDWLQNSSVYTDSDTLEGHDTFIPRGDYWISRRTHWAVVPSKNGAWARSATTQGRVRSGRERGERVDLLSANLIEKAGGAQLIDIRWKVYPGDKDPEQDEAAYRFGIEDATNPGALGESYDPNYLLGIQKRAAKALGWSLQDVQSMSLASLREQVRPVSPKLAQELTEAIRSMGA